MSFESIEATLNAYTPGMTPDIAMVDVFTPSFAPTGLTPIIAGLDDDTFVPFGDDGVHPPSSPIVFEGDGLHDELVHPEVLAAAGSPPVPVTTASPAAVVPNTDMDFDTERTLQDDILSLNLPPLPKPGAYGTVKTEAMAMAEDDDNTVIKREPCAVPQLPPVTAGKKKRPPRGPGSRRKLQEDIRDDLDARIYSLVPADKLRLPKAEFQAWKDASDMPKLTGPERRRLAEIRRMILARVYAERNRLRKIEESQRSGHTLARAQTENERLRRKVAKLESALAKYKQMVAEFGGPMPRGRR